MIFSYINIITEKVVYKYKKELKNISDDLKIIIILINIKLISNMVI